MCLRKESSDQTAAFLPLLVVFTIPPSSARFLFMCFGIFAATGQHCQQTRGVSASWFNIWVCERSGIMWIVSLSDLCSSLYSEHKYWSYFPSLPLICFLVYFLSFLSWLQLFSSVKGFTLRNILSVQLPCQQPPVTKICFSLRCWVRRALISSSSVFSYCVLHFSTLCSMSMGIFTFLQHKTEKVYLNAWKIQGGQRKMYASFSWENNC